jgi:GGDEF domain-containing protein
MPDAMTETSNPPTASLSETAAWKEVTLQVLGATAEHAIHCGDAEVEPFRQLVRDSVAGLKAPANPAQVLIAAGVLSQAIAHYSAQTQREVDALLADLSTTIQEFLGHLEHLHGDAESQGMLAELRKTLQSGIQAGRLREAQAETTKFLEELSRQADERRQKSRELTDQLQDRITVLEHSLANGRPIAVVPASIDACTGLPSRPEAEAALHRAIETGAHAYAAVFYVHRMALTNARFGEAIGNQVILFCSQHIATRVTQGNDQLFRWSGPAFTAILDRRESILNVSSDILRIVATPLSRFFETQSRSVYLPVRLTAHVIPLFDSNYAEVSSEIERFILTTSGQGNPD